MKQTPEQLAKVAAMMRDPYAAQRGQSELRKQFPTTYGALGGLVGTAPDEFEGSVLDPGQADVRRGAEMTFPVGTALNVVGGLPLKSKQIIAGVAQAARNAAKPASMSKQAGKVLVKPQTAAERHGMALPGYHFSQAERTSLNPAMFGTGLKGSARDELMADPATRYNVSFYTPKKGVVRPESGVGGVAHESQLEKVYDADADELRLVGKTRAETVKNLEKHGFKGMLNRMDGEQPGQVIMFGKEAIPTKSLGPRSKLEGLTDVAPPKARTARGRDAVVDKLQADKTLPMGQMTPEQWGKALAKKDPELHAEMAKAGVFEGTGTKYKGDLLADFKARTEAPDYTLPEPTRERTVMAPKEVDVAKRYLTGDKAGTYRGSDAFGGITPQKAGSMQKEYTAKMEEGAPYRTWYDKSSKAIHDWTGGDAAKSDLMANFLAETSARTPVGSNLMYANKAWNQGLLGEEIKSGGFPNVMGANMTKMLRNPDDAVQGLKRSPFSAGLSVNWRGADFANRPTHDIHDVRAWGITDPKTGELWSKGVPDAGHRLLDDWSKKVTDKANRDKLGGFDDWNPYRGQAAAWISQKAKTDGTPIAQAAKDYSEAAPTYQAQMTREWAPGTNTGHLPEYSSLSDEAKQEYAQLMERQITGRAGIDKLSNDVGALTGPTVPNVGSYEGAVEPGFITPVNVGKESGGQAMDPASQKLMDALASAHGILGTQKQVAHNYAGNALKVGAKGGFTPTGDMTAIRMPGGFVDDEAMKAQAEALRAIDPDMVPQRDIAGGTRALMFGDKGRQNDIAQQLRALGGPEPTFHPASGNLIPFNAPDKWSAKPFVEAIEAGGEPLAAKVSSAMQANAAPLLQASEAFAAKHNLTNAPWYKPMMEGIAQGGLPRLKELIAAGTVPVMMLSILGGEESDAS